METCSKTIDKQSENETNCALFDWSEIHQPSKDCLLYNIPKDANEWSALKLSSQQIDQFWKDGFLLDIPMLTDEQCDLLLDDYSHFMNDECSHPAKDLLYEYHSSQTPDDPDNVLVHVLGHWRLTQHFHDLVFNPKIVVPCSQLVVEGQVDTSLRLWHDQLFGKPAGHGGVVAWHQDYSYWTRTQPQMHITVHIALDEQTEENGCLMYIPGSHRWNRDGKPLPVLDFNFKDMEGIKTILTSEELINFAQPVKALLKKGHASIHHSSTVHGSYANRSAGPRRAAVVNYFADGVVSATDKFLLCPDGDPKYHAAENIPSGQKMTGQFYPLVYKPEWSVRPVVNAYSLH